MNELSQLYSQLAAAGIPPAEIPSVIQRLAAEMERRKAAARASGYTDTYLKTLTGPQVFGLGDTVSLLTGQNEIDRQERLLQEAAAVQQTRATTGVSLLDYYRQLANDNAQREAEPFRLTEFLAANAGLPQGVGASIQELIGKGFTIKPQLASPLADPKYNALLDRLTDFSRPRTPEETVKETQRGQEAAARAQYGDAAIDRVAAARKNLGDEAVLDLFRRMEEADRAKKMARGGKMTVRGPHMLMDMMTGEPRAIMGEAGDEQIKVTPLSQRFKAFASGGTINVDVPDNPYGKELPGYTSSKPGTSQKGLDQYYRMGGKGGGSSLDIAYRLRAGKASLGGLKGAMKGLRAIKGMNPRNRPTATKPTRALAGLTPKDTTRGTGNGGEGIVGGPFNPNAPLVPGVGGSGGSIGPVATPTEISPAQAAAIAVGRAIQNHPFAPPELIADLLAGRAPRPSAVTDQFLRTVPPSIAQAIVSVIQGFGYKGQDYEADRQKYAIPGLRLSA